MCMEYTATHYDAHEMIYVYGVSWVIEWTVVPHDASSDTLIYPLACMHPYAACRMPLAPRLRCCHTPLRHVFAATCVWCDMCYAFDM